MTLVALVLFGLMMLPRTSAFLTVPLPTTITRTPHTNDIGRVGDQENCIINGADRLSSHSRLYGAAIHAKKVQTALSSNNAFRGKLLIIASKIFVSPTKYWEVAKRIGSQTFLPEIFLIAACVQAQPLAKWWYARQYADLLDQDGKDFDDKDDDEKQAAKALLQKSFLASKTYKFARVLNQVGLLQAALYASDVTCVILKLLDFSFVEKYQAQRVAGSILLSCWSAYNVSFLKYRYFQRRTITPGKSAINGESSTTTGSFTPRTLNRLADILIYACAFLTVVDLLGVEIGFALKSIFGLGSFGTLALSLASKDLAAEFVGGLMIQTSNFFNEGETVALQDGTRGSVAKIGWLVSAANLLREKCVCVLVYHTEF